jgi:uncharacterized membrane protein YeaQ/YmgE (transglycosylase-associated protein family)
MLRFLHIAIGLLIGLIAEKIQTKNKPHLIAYTTSSMIGSVSGGWSVETLSLTSLQDEVVSGLALSFIGGAIMAILTYLTNVK